jgi:N-acetylglutamate synthase-like GNAT family acetyltransferase
MKVTQPQTASEWEAYYDLRWRVLRAPWNQPKGSEQDDMEASCYHCMVIDNDGTVAGAGRLQLNSPELAQIRYMAVDLNLHGKGLGKKIMNALEEEASRRGAKSVFLQAREIAVPFYLACGYEIIEKTFLLYDSIQHYSMKKNL